MTEPDNIPDPLTPQERKQLERGFYIRDAIDSAVNNFQLGGTSVELIRVPKDKKRVLVIFGADFHIVNKWHPKQSCSIDKAEVKKCNTVLKEIAEELGYGGLGTYFTGYGIKNRRDITNDGGGKLYQLVCKNDDEELAKIRELLAKKAVEMDPEVVERWKAAEEKKLRLKHERRLSDEAKAENTAPEGHKFVSMLKNPPKPSDTPPRNPK